MQVKRFDAIDARYRIRMTTNVAYQSHMYRGNPMISLLKKNKSENLAVAHKLVKCLDSEVQSREVVLN